MKMNIKYVVRVCVFAVCSLLMLASGVFGKEGILPGLLEEIRSSDEHLSPAASDNTETLYIRQGLQGDAQRYSEVDELWQEFYPNAHALDVAMPEEVEGWQTSAFEWRFKRAKVIEHLAEKYELISLQEKMRLAESRETSALILGVLSKDANVDVRRRVAENLSMDIHDLRLMQSSDPDEVVRGLAKTNSLHARTAFN